MKKNLNTADRLIRILVAVVIGILYFTNQITGTAAVILGVLALVFTATAFMSFCPIYWTLGISTKQKKTVKQ
jgi:hypothetical protein